MVFGELLGPGWALRTAAIGEGEADFGVTKEREDEKKVSVLIQLRVVEF